MTTKLEDLLLEIKKEYQDAEQKFNSFNSCHEGYAIIKEELDELWEEIKKKRELRNKDNLKKEAIQVAAMALRFCYDCCK